MKKLICISILVCLVVMAAILPNTIRRSKDTYEKRMVAVVGAIKKQFSIAAADESVAVAIYAPVVNLHNDGRILSVSGIVELKALSGRQQLDQFSAKIRNECEAQYSPECLRIFMLSLSGNKSTPTSEIASLLPNFALLPIEQAPGANGKMAGTDTSAQVTAGVTDSPEKAAAKPGKETKQAKIAPKATPRRRPKKKRATTKPQDADADSQAKPETAEAPTRKTAEDKNQARLEPTAEQKAAEEKLAAEKAAAEKAASEKLAAEKAAAEKAALENAVAKTAAEPPAPPARRDDGAKTPQAPGTAQTRGGQRELSARFLNLSPNGAPAGEVKDSPDRVLRIQLALRRFGYDPGRADNVVGEKTRDAILTYQRHNGLEATGEPSLDLLKHILASSPSQQHARAETGNGSATGERRADPQTSVAAADTTRQVAQIQRELRKFGYDPGQVDNVAGRKTRQAIIAYQRRNGLEPTGEPTLGLLNHMREINSQSNTR